jgi:chromosome segregation protein
VIARLGDAFLKDLRAGRRERPDPQMVTTLESSMRRLRGKIGEMGDTDTSVLAEEAEVEQRVTGLREQVHDLDGASAHLREGIRELDAFIHRQFSEGMHSMGEAFHAYFRQIFGGGRAGLSLVTPRPVEHALPDVPAGGIMATLPDAVEDVPEQGEGSHVHELPAGVEIRATPPGKKLTSIDQLSGGEKALTSIALLFAILSQRPSPFIVLDEVDAALDEANSQRFARMLQKLARSSQFLVITHNRATMEAAGALYVITMSDDGISQLLSIRLSEVPERLGEETHIPHQHR